MKENGGQKSNCAYEQADIGGNSVGHHGLSLVDIQEEHAFEMVHSKDENLGFIYLIPIPC